MPSPQRMQRTHFHTTPSKSVHGISPSDPGNEYCKEKQWKYSCSKRAQLILWSHVRSPVFLQILLFRGFVTHGLSRLYTLSWLPWPSSSAEAATFREMSETGSKWPGVRAVDGVRRVSRPPLTAPLQKAFPFASLRKGLAMRTLLRMPIFHFASPSLA